MEWIHCFLKETLLETNHNTFGLCAEINIENKIEFVVSQFSIQILFQQNWKFEILGRSIRTLAYRSLFLRNENQSINQNDLIIPIFVFFPKLFMHIIKIDAMWFVIAIICCSFSSGWKGIFSINRTLKCNSSVETFSQRFRYVKSTICHMIQFGAIWCYRLRKHFHFPREHFPFAVIWFPCMNLTFVYNKVR